MNDIFITENFLLQNAAAVELYHGYARDMPILDYHCHLPAEQIARDHRFENLTQIWLAGDHYKWRAMRAAGVEERFCTGDASDWEKFAAWAEDGADDAPQSPVSLDASGIEASAGHLRPAARPGNGGRHLGRVQREAGRAGLLVPRHHAANERRARLHDRRSHRLARTPRGDPRRRLLRHPRPADVPAGQGHGRRIARSRSTPGSTAWPSGPTSTSRTSRRSARRFAGGTISSTRWAAACRTTGWRRCTPRNIRARTPNTIFQRIRRGNDLRPEEILKFKSAMLHEFALMDHEKGWTQQFHIGAMRNNNTRMFEALGPDTGFDSMGDLELARPLARFLDRLDRGEKLAKTILYNLNPAHNDLVATMIGNFQGGGIAGQDAVRQRLVVSRSEGRHGEAARRAIEPRAARAGSSAC